MKTPTNHREAQMQIRFAIALLRQARTELRRAGARKSYVKTCRAIASSEGALRNAYNRPYRVLRRPQPLAHAANG